MAPRRGADVRDGERHAPLMPGERAPDAGRTGRGFRAIDTLAERAPVGGEGGARTGGGRTIDEAHDDRLVPVGADIDNDEVGLPQHSGIARPVGGERGSEFEVEQRAAARGDGRGAGFERDAIGGGGGGFGHGQVSRGDRC